MKRALEETILYALLLLSIGSLNIIFLGPGLQEKSLDQGFAETSVGIRLSVALIDAGCIALILIHSRRMLAALKSGWPFLPLVFLTCLSSFWSIDPSTTLRRSIVFLGTTLFGIYLGGRYTTQQLQEKLLRFFLFVMAASCLLTLLEPSYTIDVPHGFAFRGITIHKNIFGEYVGEFLLLVLTYPFRAKFGYAQLGCMLIAVVALAASHAATALISAAAAVLLMPVFAAFRFRKEQVAPLFIGGLLVVGLAFLTATQHSEALLSGLGKDSTLTGRSTIWSFVLQSVGRRPLLGYGYDAFWQGLRGESLLLTSQVGWEVPHSHDGYLEVLLATGVAGLLLFLVCVLRMLTGSISYLRRHRGLLGLWPASFLAYYLIHAVTEASLLTREGLSYLLFVALATSVALEVGATATREESEPAIVLTMQES